MAELHNNLFYQLLLPNYTQSSFPFRIVPLYRTMNGEWQLISSSLSDCKSASLSSRRVFLIATYPPEPLSNALYTSPYPPPLSLSIQQIPCTQQFPKFIIIHLALVSEGSDEITVNVIKLCHPTNNSTFSMKSLHPPPQCEDRYPPSRHCPHSSAYHLSACLQAYHPACHPQEHYQPSSRRSA